MAHKLLLADDSVTIQRVIELTFADEDVQVLTAGDGEQAISSIQAERPDIVLADVGMPKRSGYDVAAFVKGAPELAHIPVLLLTGAFEPVDERRAQAAGCDGVLVKPFEPQHVIARVRELLQGVPGNAQARPSTVTRAVADVPRPVERLAPQRPQPVRPAPEPPRPTQEGVRHGSDLDDYFDRLDAAFANMTSAAEAHAPHHPEAMPRHEGPVMERDLDWFDSPSQQHPPAQAATPPAPPAEAAGESAIPIQEPPARSPLHAEPIPEPVRVTFASPPASPPWPAPQPPSIEPPDSEPTRAVEPSPASASQSAIAPGSGSGSIIADAFSALLAAEQGEPDARPVRLSFGASSPAVTDELVDEIARRVIERLGTDAVHDLVADVVSRVAERLVREEIERIRRKHS
jgi:CheY-like chemotaxis protein